MNSGKVVLGVLAGLAAGAILGILFASEKGKKTRKQIFDKGEHYVDDVKQKFDSTKKNVEEFVDEKKSKYESIKKDLNHTPSDVKHAVS